MINEMIRVLTSHKHELIYIRLEARERVDCRERHGGIVQNWLKILQWCQAWKDAETHLLERDRKVLISGERECLSVQS